MPETEAKKAKQFYFYTKYWKYNTPQKIGTVRYETTKKNEFRDSKNNFQKITNN